MRARILTGKQAACARAILKVNFRSRFCDGYTIGPLAYKPLHLRQQWQLCAYKGPFQDLLTQRLFVGRRQLERGVLTLVVPLDPGAGQAVGAQPEFTEWKTTLLLEK